MKTWKNKIVIIDEFIMCHIMHLFRIFRVNQNVLGVWLFAHMIVRVD